MDMEGFDSGGLPIHPDDYRVEITSACEQVMESIERRDTELKFAMQDLAKATETEYTMAAMHFLARSATIEQEHQGRMVDASKAMTARMVLDLAESGKMELPEPIREMMEEALGIKKAVTDGEPSGGASIDGIGSFDDLPVAEPDRKGIRDADGGFGNDDAR